MSADLFAAFVAGHAEGSTNKSNVTAQAQVVASGSLSNGFHAKTGPMDLSRTQQEENPTPPLWQKDCQGTDILFDAEEAGEDDEFGDFEDVDAGNAIGETPNLRMQNNALRTTQPLSPAQYSRDLISLEPEHRVSATESSASDTHKPQESKISLSPKRGLDEQKADWDDDWGDFEYTSLEDKPLAQSGKSGVVDQRTNINPGPADGGEEDWEPFEDGQPQRPLSYISSQSQPPAKSAALEHIITPASNKAVERPTNVPPPATLLQLLSSVFEAINDLNKAGQESKQVLALRILVIFRVISRIIAGKTLRWKRDTILAQSMRIGQAGNSGGMKLTSVNKGESVREEREVGDLISHWSRYAHEFNSILAQAHMTGSRLRLTSSLSLKVLKGTGSSKQCALCGLQRTERINGIDTDTEDLFGEFWTEHWGHKDCSEFWYLYKGLLSQR